MWYGSTAIDDVIFTCHVQANQAAWLSWLVMAVIGSAVGLTAWSMQLVRAGNICKLIEQSWIWLRRERLNQTPAVAVQICDCCLLLCWSGICKRANIAIGTA